MACAQYSNLHCARLYTHNISHRVTLWSDNVFYKGISSALHVQIKKFTLTSCAFIPGQGAKLQIRPNANLTYWGVFDIHLHCNDEAFKWPLRSTDLTFVLSQEMNGLDLLQNLFLSLSSIWVGCRALCFNSTRIRDGYAETLRSRPMSTGTPASNTRNINVECSILRHRRSAHQFWLGSLRFRAATIVAHMRCRQFWV